MLGDNYLPFGALREQKERPLLIQRRLEAISAGRADDLGDNPEIAPEVFDGR